MLRRDEDEGVGMAPVVVVVVGSISSWWMRGLLVIGGSIEDRRRGREDEAEGEAKDKDGGNRDMFFFWLYCKNLDGKWEWKCCVNEKENRHGAEVENGPSGWNNTTLRTTRERDRRFFFDE